MAVVGDSFVRAIHVDRDKTLTARLDHYLQSRTDTPGAALSFGISAAGPPEYLEILSLANEYHSPTHAIVFFYLGNDFRNCVEMDEPDPGKSLRQTLNSNGELQWDPGSVAYRERYRRILVRPYLGLRATLGESMGTYIMLNNALQSVRYGLRARATVGLPKSSEADRRADDGWTALGLNPMGFKTELSDRALRSRAIMKGYLKAYQEFAAQEDIQISFVSIPHFSGQFYGSQEGTHWSPVLGEYDLFGPDQFLAEATSELGLPFLSLGTEMKRQGLSVPDIQQLYLIDGKGHFSEAGHEFAAKSSAADTQTRQLSGAKSKREIIKKPKPNKRSHNYL